MDFVRRDNSRLPIIYMGDWLFRFLRRESGDIRFVFAKCYREAGPDTVFYFDAPV